MDCLIGSIYEAAYTPELWPKVTQGVAEAVGAAAAGLIFQDAMCINMPATTAEYGYTPARIKSYHDYFWKVDARTDATKNLPAGGMLIDGYNFDFGPFVETEIYQDYWKPAGLGEGIGGIIFKDAFRFSSISARRLADQGSFTDTDVQTFQRLLQHMQRSFELQTHLQMAQQKADTLTFALDHFPVAVFLMDRRCVVHDLNRAARKLLTNSNSPFRLYGQKLSADRSQDGRTLQEAVRIASNSLHDIKALPPLLRFYFRDGVQVLMLTPMPISGSLLNTSADFVLLFCRDAKTSFVDPLRLRGQFGFTPAESSLVVALVEGSTLEEFAVRRRVTIETVRSQLKSAMSKASVHTQAQLVGTVLGSLAALVWDE